MTLYPVLGIKNINTWGHSLVLVTRTNNGRAKLSLEIVQATKSRISGHRLYPNHVLVTIDQHL